MVTLLHILQHLNNQTVIKVKVKVVPHDDCTIFKSNYFSETEDLLQNYQ